MDKTNATLLFVISIVCLTFAAKDMEKSLTDIIREDKGISTNTPEFLYKSNYTKVCNSFSYPDAKISLENINHYMCVAIYGLSYEISYTESRIAQKNRPNSADDFSRQLEKLESAKNYSSNFCSSLSETLKSPELIELSKYLLNVKYNQTKENVENLNKLLADNGICEKVCINLDKTVIPLCSALSWANQFVVDGMKMLRRNLEIGPNPKTKNQGIEPNAVKKNTDNKADPNSTKPIAGSISKQSKMDDNQKKINTSNPNAKAIAVEKHTVKGGEVPPVDNNQPREENVDNDEKKQPKETVDNVNQVSTKEKTISDTIKIEPNQFNIEDSSKDSPQPDEASEVMISPTIKKSDFSQQARKDNESLDQLDFENDGNDSVNSENSGNEPVNSEKDNDANKQQMPSIEKTPTDIDTDGQSQISESEEKVVQRVKSRIHMEDVDVEFHFFPYFMVASLLCIGGYVGYHNKQKILAIVLEGRRSKGGRGRRRPKTAGYHKLECTLEEAVTSQCNSNVTHVIY